MLCFSYGSNMSSRRLAARIPARFVATAVLPAYRLAFHQRSTDGSGKCDIVPASDQAAVYGVVWEVAEQYKPALDDFEGLGRSYTQTWLTVADLHSGQWLEVQVYTCLITCHRVQPYTWYKQHVLSGAKEHRLPKPYIRALEQVTAIDDADNVRHSREIAIYSDLLTEADTQTQPLQSIK